MVAAFLRLLLITVGSLILAFFAVFFVRQMGLHQTFAPPQHKWFELKEWNVLSPSAENLCKMKLDIAENQILELAIRFRSGMWIIDCPDKNVTLPLKDALIQVKAVHILLQVNANETENLDNLVEIVGSYDARKNFGVASVSQKVSRAFRKKAPQYLFASDSASLLRMQLFTSLWIETAMEFWPDFVIAGQNEDTNVEHFNPRLIEELARRHKPIIWADQSIKPPFQVRGFLTKQ